MKIAMLGKWSKGTEIGGVTVHNVNLVKQLAKSSELNLSFVSFGDRTDVLNEGRAKIVLMKAQKIYYVLPPLALIRLSMEVRKIKPDIIHVQGSNLSPYLLYTLFFAKKIQKVITFHSCVTKEQVGQGTLKPNSLRYKLLKRLEKEEIKKFDLIIVVTSRLCKLIIMKFGEKVKERIVVIPNGVNSKFFYQGINGGWIRRQLNIPNDDFIIFHAKAFVPVNGQEYLIKAMPEILKAIPNARLILAGDGPLRNPLTQMSKDLGIYDRVIFLGHIPNSQIPYNIAAANTIIIPSVQCAGFEEGSSIFLLEAMAMKKPVIATSVGGLKEGIANGVNGILIPGKDQHAIAEAVLRLFNDPVFAKKLGECARRYVEEERTWDVIAKKVIEVYEKLHLRE